MSPFTEELVAISRALGVYEKEAVCCGTVTVPQCVAMQDLAAAGPRDVTTLAARLGVTKGAVTRLIDGLERRGFVERLRSGEDRRRVEVGLTDEGRREAQRLLGLSDAAVGAVLSQIPGEKHALVLEALRLLRVAVGQARTELSRCCC